MARKNHRGEGPKSKLVAPTSSPLANNSSPLLNIATVSELLLINASTVTLSQINAPAASPEAKVSQLEAVVYRTAKEEDPLMEMILIKICTIHFLEQLHNGVMVRHLSREEMAEKIEEVLGGDMRQFGKGGLEIPESVDGILKPGSEDVVKKDDGVDGAGEPVISKGTGGAGAVLDDEGDGDAERKREKTEHRMRSFWKLAANLRAKVLEMVHRTNL